MSAIMENSFMPVELPESLRETWHMAENKDPYAMAQIADWLVYCNGNKKLSRVEARLARKLYRKAIARGNTNALLNYGGMYNFDDGLRKDHIKAHLLFLLSLLIYKINPGADRSGYRALGNFWRYDEDEKGTPVPTENKLRIFFAWLWYRAGARNKEMNSLYELGDMYMSGTLVRKDAQKSFDFYIQSLAAIETGPCPEKDDNYDDVLLRLAKCYHYGIGVETDLIVAESYAREAVEKYSEIVDKGGTWDEQNLEYAKAELAAIREDKRK